MANTDKLELSFSKYFLIFVLYWGAFSSAAIMVLVEFVGVRNPSIYSLKDLPVYMFMLLSFPLWLLRADRVLFSFIFFLFFTYLVANLYFLNPDYSSPLANIRQIVAPIVLLFFFCSLRMNESSWALLFRNSIFVFLLVFSFGFIEIFFEIWKSVGLHNYFNLKGIPVDQHGLSYMFYEPSIGYRERMTSTFLDPISLGHSFAAILIFIFYNKSEKYLKHRYFFIFVFSLGVLLTFSKGAMLQVFLAFFIFNPRIHFLFRFLLSFFPLVVFWLMPVKKGVLIHLNGFFNSLDTISIFGYGIGSVGNYAKMFSDDLTVYYDKGISDTYIGSIIGQLGFFGFGFWVFVILFSIFPINRKNPVPFIILASQVLVSFLSENTLNVTSFLIPALVIAMSRMNLLKNKLGIKSCEN
ncbi:MAG: hypothetical protein ACTJHW_02335 [Paenalcaligenes sp.]